ncbi:MAG: MAPEG family protein [Deltaproteobacteria bacterium]|nr:MAPEG family protein [Deltaproteobacteria bacterium]
MSIPAGPAWVTLVYLALYYVFMTYLLVVKQRLRKQYTDRGETFDRYFGEDREMLAADRIQLNMLEHMPVFLALLWMTAFAVSPREATIVGGLYTLNRAIYPLVLGKRLGRGTPPRILFVTFSGYGLLLWMMVRIGMSLV